MDTEVKRAEIRDYDETLRDYIDDLTLLYEAMLTKWAKYEADDELVNATLAKMIAITGHLLPQLDSGGDKWKSLRSEFVPYESWLDSIQIPKTIDEEADKIPGLYKLILKAYHKLGLTNI